MRRLPAFSPILFSRHVTDADDFYSVAAFSRSIEDQIRVRLDWKDAKAGNPCVPAYTAATGRQLSEPDEFHP